MPLALPVSFTYKGKIYTRTVSETPTELKFRATDGSSAVIAVKSNEESINLAVNVRNFTTSRDKVYEDHSYFGHKSPRHNFYDVTFEDWCSTVRFLWSEEPDDYEGDPIEVAISTLLWSL